jgi:hypothetical protein
MVPFSLFIGTYRRRKILDAMMGKDERTKKDGEVILNNYKKQLAEKMAREKADRGETISCNSSKKGSKKSYKEDDVKSSKYNDHIGGNLGVEAMEPEILL